MLSSFFHTCQVLVLFLLLGACQRTSYSFQSLGASATLASPLTAPASDTLVAEPQLAVALPMGTQRLRRPHRLHHPRAAATALGGTALARPRLWQVLATAHAAKAAVRQQPLPADEPVRHRSRGIALLLAALPFLFGLPLGLHYFYLGYIGRGILSLIVAAVATVLIILGAVGAFLTLFTASSGALTLVTIGAVLLSILFLIQLIDAVRIALGDLRPKNGEYYPRFFQTRPAATPAPPVQR